MNSPSSESIATWPIVQKLTDEQWQRVAPLLLEALSDGPRRGRPPIDIRHVLNSVMWVLHTRAGSRTLVAPLDLLAPERT